MDYGQLIERKVLEKLNEFPFGSEHTMMQLKSYFPENDWTYIEPTIKKLGDRDYISKSFCSEGNNGLCYKLTNAGLLHIRKLEIAEGERMLAERDAREKDLKYENVNGWMIALAIIAAAGAVIASIPVIVSWFKK